RSDGRAFYDFPGHGTGTATVIDADGQPDDHPWGVALERRSCCTAGAKAQPAGFSPRGSGTSILVTSPGLPLRCSPHPSLTAAAPCPRRAACRARFARQESSPPFGICTGGRGSFLQDFRVRPSGCTTAGRVPAGIAAPASGRVGTTGSGRHSKVLLGFDGGGWSGGDGCEAIRCQPDG